MSITPVSPHVFLIDTPFRGENSVLGTYFIQGKRSVILDPGPTVSIPYVSQALNKLGATDLSHIIPTHIHLDHSGGTWKLMESYPSTTLLVHPRGTQHMKDPSKLEAGATALFGDHVKDYGAIRGTPPERTFESKDGQVIDLGGVTIKNIWTPGHAAHHQCLYVKEDRVLIVGDAAGYYKNGIIMPTSPPPFNPVKAIESLNRLVDLAPETICYGHYGHAGEAVKKLIFHREQLKIWLKVIKHYWGTGKSLDKIYKAIQKADLNTFRAGEYSLETGVRTPFINLQGFIKYLEWKKK
jgi:glyoxylase-like metal-dependent hydrolase (beta-lactamase superfamily II)